MLLGKLPVSGRPTNLNFSMARAFYTCSRCGLGLFGHFRSSITSLFFSSPEPKAPGELIV